MLLDMIHIQAAVNAVASMQSHCSDNNVLLTLTHNTYKRGKP